MTDIVQLGFEIDTSALAQAKQGAQQLAEALNKVADAGDRQATAATKQTTATKTTTQATKEATQATKEQADAHEKVANTGGKVTTALSGIGQAMQTAGSAAQTVTNHMTALSGVIGGGGGGVGGGLASGLSAASSGMGGLASAMGPTALATAGLATGVIGLVAGYAKLVTSTYKQQEAFLLIEGRLKNVYGSGLAASQMFAQLTALADKNGTAIEQTADAFLRLARNNEAIGLTKSEMIDLTDAVQKLGRVSGASSGELASGMLQFSQALASGRLNGDELRSIMEQMPALTKTIADGLGVSVGAIRQMGADGQLTGDKITGAILKQLPKIEEQFKGLPETSDQAFQRVENNWDRLIANMGTRLKSSQIMTFIGNVAAGAVGAAATAIAPETDADRLASLQRADEQERLAQINGSFGRNPWALDRAWRNRDARRDASADNSSLEGRVLTEQIRAQANEDTNVFRAPFVRSQTAIQGLDDNASKVKTLTEQIKTLEAANERFKQNPFMFEPEQRAQLAKYPDYIAALKTQLENTRPVLDAFQQQMTEHAADLAKFGFGGAASAGSDARSMVAKAAGAGQNVSEEQALNAIMAQRAQSVAEQAKAMEIEIDAQKRLTEATGQGKQASIEAEVATKTYKLQMEQFGKDVGPAAAKSLQDYADNLRKLLQLQKEVTDGQRLYNAQLALGNEQQIAAAIAAGKNAGQIAQIRRNQQTQNELLQERGGAATAPAADGATTTGGAIEGKIRAGVNTAGMQSAVTEVVNAILQEFPKAVLTSGYRSAATNRGAKHSQHLNGEAADLNLSALSDEEKAALVQGLTSGKYGRVGGLGMYSPSGDLLHVDTRDARMAWGPNYSRTSLGNTPDYFQNAVNPWMAGQGGGAIARSTAERAITTEGQTRDLQARNEDAKRLADTERRIRDLEEQKRAATPSVAREAQNRQQARDYAADFAPEQQAAAEAAKLKELHEQDAATVASRNRDLEIESDILRLQYDAVKKTGVEQQAALKTIEQIAEARRQGLDLTDEEIKKLQQRNLEDAKAGKRNDQAKKESAEYEKIWTTTADAIGGAIESAFRDAVMNGKVDAQKILKSLVADIGSQILKAMTTPLVNGLTSGLQSLFSGLVPSADGNVFGGGARMAFASGGIIGSPRYFPMANGGTGLAGEAGAEAIMPLKRGPDGKLGVASSGGGGGKTSVVINDMRTAAGSQQVETDESTGPDGQRVIQIMIRDEVQRSIRNGETDSVMASSYGLTRSLTKR